MDITLARASLEKLGAPYTQGLVAQGEDGQPLGYISLTTEVERSTNAKIGYISDLAVTREAEDQGIGKPLKTGRVHKGIVR